MKALAIAVWIGPLPGWFALWLRSAANNPALDFLVVSDQPAPASLPGNVVFQAASLGDLRARWSSQLGLAVSLEQPYKLCDFKPLYWMLADRLDAYDYWGFCDLDVIWGDLSPLLQGALGKFDAVLGEGHLRLFRNTDACRNLYRHAAMTQDWRQVLAAPQIFGFDEHPGINRALGAGPFSWFADPALIADIDADFRQFRLVPQAANPRVQAYCWEHGRVWRDSWQNGACRREEFLYIHFQKRALAVAPGAAEAAAVDIDPAGIAPRLADNSSRAALAARNPWHLPNRLEARILARELWRRMRRRPPPLPVFGSLDRSGAA